MYTKENRTFIKKKGDFHVKKTISHKKGNFNTKLKNFKC